MKPIGHSGPVPPALVMAGGVAEDRLTARSCCACRVLSFVVLLRPPLRLCLSSTLALTDGIMVVDSMVARLDPTIDVTTSQSSCANLDTKSSSSLGDELRNADNGSASGLLQLWKKKSFGSLPARVRAMPCASAPLTRGSHIASPRESHVLGHVSTVPRMGSGRAQASSARARACFSASVKLMGSFDQAKWTSQYQDNSRGSASSMPHKAHIVERRPHAWQHRGGSVQRGVWQHLAVCISILIADSERIVAHWQGAAPPSGHTPTISASREGKLACAPALAASARLAAFPCVGRNHSSTAHAAASGCCICTHTRALGWRDTGESKTEYWQSL
jgi:hypothetical protein